MTASSAILALSYVATCDIGYVLIYVVAQVRVRGSNRRIELNPDI